MRTKVVREETVLPPIKEVVIAEDCSGGRSLKISIFKSSGVYIGIGYASIYFNTDALGDLISLLKEMHGQLKNNKGGGE